MDTNIDWSSASLTSAPLDDGTWYFHIRAVDHAGVAGPAAHFGPFMVDATAPSGCWLNAPRYSNSATCQVAWRASDATSGIDHYDVQVRDDLSPAGIWQDWLVSTPLTTALYSDAELGVCSFRVRAYDRAGNVNAYGCEDDTTVEDLAALGLEVTQAIQNRANDVTSIAGKDTYVRLYAGTHQADVSSVHATLYGARDGAALPGSPLRPTGGRITVRAGGGERANLNDAFYFRLPDAWRSGTVTLRGVVNPAGDIPEDDAWSNESSETVGFEAPGDFCIVFVPVHLHPATYYIDYLRSTARAATVNPVIAAPVQADGYLLTGGIIGPTGQTAELRSFYHTPTLTGDFAQSAGDGGRYTLALEDGGGAVLYSHPFSATRVTAYDGEQVRIRVTVTDGVHSAYDESDAAFSVPRKAPQAFILEPDGDSYVAAEDVVVLRGTGLDAEDGLIATDTAITWTSDLSGTLGAGGELWVENLPVGAHRITLTLSDSDGQSGTDSIMLYVGIALNKLYLPVILR